MSDESNESASGEGLPSAPNDDPRWLDRPENVNVLIKLLIAACILSVMADFFYHKHAEFHFQQMIGFDAVYGFVAYVGLVNLAKGLRLLLMRNEDYYD